MSGIEDRFALVELTSINRPLSTAEKQQYWDAVGRSCSSMVAMYGFEVAMCILIGTPLVKRAFGVIMSNGRPRKMYATTGDLRIVKSVFVPARYTTGICSSCHRRCYRLGSPITRWGSAYSRYECWAEEMRWITEEDAAQRAALTQIYWQKYEGHTLPRPYYSFDQIDEKLVRGLQTRAQGAGPDEEEKFYARTAASPDVSITFTGLDGLRSTLMAAGESIAAGLPVSIMGKEAEWRSVFAELCAEMPGYEIAGLYRLEPGSCPVNAQGLNIAGHEGKMLRRPADDTNPWRMYYRYGVWWKFRVGIQPRLQF